MSVWMIEVCDSFYGEWYPDQFREFRKDAREDRAKIFGGTNLKTRIRKYIPVEDVRF